MESYRSQDSFGTFFGISLLLSTDEYLPHTVLEGKVIDPQATTSSYLVTTTVYTHTEQLDD